MADTDNRPATRRLDPWTWTALLVTLVVYPALYSSGIMGRIITPIFTEHSRLHWWFFWLANLAFHWIPFALVWIALRKNREPWRSVGVDWTWFVRRKWWFGGLVAVLLTLAFIMPGIHYGGAPPPISRSHFMAPVGAWERVFLILGAFTAGVTEEVLFRGFTLTRLGRVLPSPWLALPISVASFLFMHGKPQSVEMLVAYLLAGLAFGVPFLLMGLRRLEILIVIHFLIDASMILAP